MGDIILSGAGTTAVTGTVAVSNFPANQNVTVTNAAGASAVNIQDGGNSITVDNADITLSRADLDLLISALGINSMPTPIYTVVVGGRDGTNTRTLKTDTNGELQIDVLTSGLPTGAATSTLQTQPGVDIGDVTINNAAGASAVNIQDGGNSITIDGTISGTGTFTTKEVRSASVAQSSVNDTASNVTLLASNTNRLGATIFNDSTVTLYLKLGATASTTSFTVAMVAASYYEVPFAYTGIIDGIWASDASGAARITELTA